MFVDVEPRACRLIEENLRRCGIADRYAIIREGLAPALVRLPAGEHFDLILFDPAYEARDADTLLTELAGRVAPGGLLVYEHARRRPAPETAGPIVRVREIRAGDSVLAFYRSSSSSARGSREAPEEASGHQ
jgi:16S rRNA G966 N2-methylase RsmD